MAAVTALGPAGRPHHQELPLGEEQCMSVVEMVGAAPAFSRVNPQLSVFLLFPDVAVMWLGFQEAHICPPSLWVSACGRGFPERTVDDGEDISSHSPPPGSSCYLVSTSGLALFLLVHCHQRWVSVSAL